MVFKDHMTRDIKSKVDFICCVCFKCWLIIFLPPECSASAFITSFFRIGVGRLHTGSNQRNHNETQMHSCFTHDTDLSLTRIQNRKPCLCMLTQIYALFNARINSPSLLQVTIKTSLPLFLHLTQFISLILYSKSGHFWMWGTFYDFQKIFTMRGKID